MKKEEMLQNMAKDIEMRKDCMINSVEYELKYLNKLMEKKNSLKSTDDILNFCRELQMKCNDIAQRANSEFESIDQIRIGMYYVNCYQKMSEGK